MTHFFFMNNNYVFRVNSLNNKQYTYVQLTVDKKSVHISIFRLGAKENINISLFLNYILTEYTTH